MNAPMRAWLTDVITQEPYAGQDAYGKPTYGAPFTRPGRLEYANRLIMSQAGTQRVSTTRLYLNGDIAVDLRDRITLANGLTTPIQVLASPRTVQGAIDHFALDF